jgi:hypothetical protein
MRRFALCTTLLLIGCGGNSAAVSSADGSSESSANGTPCGDSSFFTACVHACGETNDSEDAAARCVGGRYQCDPPLIAATACDASVWTVPRLACGPWVTGYDCGQGCAVCDAGRGWTCGACPDASSAGGL